MSTLCNPFLPGSPAHGISLIQECVAFPPPGDLPDPGIELKSPVLAGGFFTIESPGKPDIEYYVGVCVSAKSLQSDSLQPHGL